MRQFDNIMIGFGKGNKTLAGSLAGAGQTVALVEQSEKMYGGTCINVACIPTKSLENSARLSFIKGGDFREKSLRYQEAVKEKRRLTAMLRQKNYDKAVSAGVFVITGRASFLDSHRVEVSLADGSKEVLYGERIFINTGSLPFIPHIEGLMENRYVYTSETLMELEELPEKLVIIGGGYIGLEFASYFINFGSKVTVIQSSEAFIPREDKETAQAVLDNLTERGIEVLCGAGTKSVKEEGGKAVLTVETKQGIRMLRADAVLVATGRRPNLKGLHPKAAGVELTAKGAVKVDKYLRTSVPHIWALGDVTGGLQFTYISLDDFRIVKDQLLGNSARTTANRGAVPYSVFLDPPLSRVGLTETEAREQGYAVKTATLPVAAIPRSHVVRKPVGMLKAIVDGNNNQILGAHFFCDQSHEMINLIKLAMDARLPYTVLRDSIFTHPTMSEAMNDLFAMVK